MEKKPLKFLGGVVRAADVEKLPLKDRPRIVFAGRSNVGKSSLLNALTGQKLARVSASPGKTREMNFYSWTTFGQEILLVDLPGYGYAKVSGKLRDEWGREIAKWLEEDEKILLVVSLVDGRHGFMPQDLELLEFMKSKPIPFGVAFTKMDKWKSNNQRKNAETQLKKLTSELSVERYAFVSVEESDGCKELRQILKSVLL